MVWYNTAFVLYYLLRKIVNWLQICKLISYYSKKKQSIEGSRSRNSLDYNYSSIYRPSSFPPLFFARSPLFEASFSQMVTSTWDGASSCTGSDAAPRSEYEVIERGEEQKEERLGQTKLDQIGWVNCMLFVCSTEYEY
jgi:hypothetical protein